MSETLYSIKTLDSSRPPRSQYSFFHWYNRKTCLNSGLVPTSFGTMHPPYQQPSFSC